MNNPRIKHIVKGKKKNYSYFTQSKEIKTGLSSPAFGKTMCSINMKDLLNIKRFELKLYARLTEINKCSKP
jgi:hypothetical protein